MHGPAKASVRLAEVGKIGETSKLTDVVEINNAFLIIISQMATLHMGANACMGFSSYLSL